MLESSIQCLTFSRYLINVYLIPVKSFLANQTSGSDSFLCETNSSRRTVVRMKQQGKKVRQVLEPVEKGKGYSHSSVSGGRASFSATG